MKKTVNNQKGIGLLELMLSLAIIAVLLVMATRYYMGAGVGSRVNQAVDVAGGLASCAGDWAQRHNGTVTGLTLSDCVNYGSIPASIVSGTNVITPWGPVPPVATATDASITFTPGTTTEVRSLLAKLCPTVTYSAQTSVKYNVLAQSCG